MFPQPKNQQTFHCEPGVPNFDGQYLKRNDRWQRKDRWKMEQIIFRFDPMIAGYKFVRSLRHQQFLRSYGNQAVASMSFIAAMKISKCNRLPWLRLSFISEGIDKSVLGPRNFLRERP